MSEPFTIACLRSELALSLEQFGAAIGISSKGHMSEIERENRSSLAVALRIEELSGGRIDASALNDDVRAARAGVVGDVVGGAHGCDHAGDAIATPAPDAAGKCRDFTAAPAPAPSVPA